MKVVTVFLLSAALLALCYCWTAHGHKSAGTRDDSRGLTKRIHHRDSLGSVQPGRQHALCVCDIDRHHLQRKKRHMNGRRKPGIRSRHCCRRHFKQNTQPDVIIPLF